MNTNDFPLDRYLARLGLDSLPPATAEGLRQLVCAQAMAIPFENLDVLAGRPVRVDPDSIAQKVLGEGRGGYCYELNGLLGEALRHAGFDFQVRMGRVNFRRPTLGPRTHLLFDVAIDGQHWFADAAFGGPGVLAPFPATSEETVDANGTRFRLRTETGGSRQLQRWMDGDWCNLYRIEPEPVLPLDLEMSNHFTSTWPHSPFRRMFMCYARTADGCWSLEGEALVRRDAQFAVVEQHALRDADHLADILRDVFRINIDPTLVAASLQRVRTERAAEAAATG